MSTVPTTVADLTRHGGYILTYTGNWFYPLDPRPEDVFLEDMAQGLSLKCRWSGQCRYFYSIAEHCLAVSIVGSALAEFDKLPSDFVDLVRKLGLVHDGNEAYLPDVPGPIKRYIVGWKDKENRVQDAIHLRLKLPLHAPDAERYVKWADLMMLTLEHEKLFARRTSAAELYNNYDEKKLWPGYPVVPANIRAFAEHLVCPDPRGEFLRRLELLFGKEN